MGSCDGAGGAEFSAIVEFGDGGVGGPFMVGGMNDMMGGVGGRW